MNYQEFRNYRDKLQSQCFRLDELNPYLLAPHFLNGSCQQSQFIDIASGYYVMQSNGVRSLLQELFKYFTKLGYQLNIPEDVYPEYFNLTPMNTRVFHYASCQQEKFTFSKNEFCISLIANPLIPEGRYLTKTELLVLDDWLLENNNRWIIFDTVYDYCLQSLDFKFKSNNIIFVNSLSKINLTPGTSGWALSKTKLPGFESAPELKVDKKLIMAIQNEYTQAWKKMDNKLHIGQKFNWKPPSVGYLSLINENYKLLLSECSIAAIPASVFGVKGDELSVFSCLSEVKQNVL